MAEAGHAKLRRETIHAEPTKTISETKVQSRRDTIHTEHNEEQPRRGTIHTEHEKSQSRRGTIHSEHEKAQSRRGTIHTQHNEAQPLTKATSDTSKPKTRRGTIRPEPETSDEEPEEPVAKLKRLLAEKEAAAIASKKAALERAAAEAAAAEAAAAEAAIAEAARKKLITIIAGLIIGSIALILGMSMMK
nr:translation initiation factor IF-2-like [Plodia interpunctella]